MNKIIKILPLSMICSGTCRGRIIRREGEKNRGARKRGITHVVGAVLSRVPFSVMSTDNKVWLLMQFNVPTHTK